MTLVLDVTPTPAMLRGDQRVYQCSWCGCVVVSPSENHRPTGPCPAEHEQPTTWWEQSFPVAGLSLRPPDQREEQPMTYLPTPEQFLAEPSTDEDDFEEVTPAAPEGFDIGIAASLSSISDSLYRLVSIAADQTESGQAMTELEERHQRLNEEYDDLEDKHRSLYELLAEVEKIVAKSSSKVSLDVKAAINAWRNPVVDPEPGSVGEPFTDAEIAAFREQPVEEQPVQGLPIPDNDAPVEAWRAYARSRGIDVSDRDNRSQIRTALGLSHFDTPAGA